VYLLRLAEVHLRGGRLDETADTTRTRLLWAEVKPRQDV
jgi:hypothetical protein